MAEATKKEKEKEKEEGKMVRFSDDCRTVPLDVLTDVPYFATMLHQGAWSALHCHQEVYLLPEMASGTFDDIAQFKTRGEMMFDDVASGAINPIDSLHVRIQAAYFLGFADTTPVLEFLKNGVGWQRVHLLSQCPPELFAATLHESHLRRNVDVDNPFHGLTLVTGEQSSLFTRVLPVFTPPSIQLLEHSPSPSIGLALPLLPEEALLNEDDDMDDLICSILQLGNVVVAGGYAAHKVCNLTYSDVDIFVWGLTPEQASAKLMCIINMLGSRRETFITGHAVTTTVRLPYASPSHRNFQVVLRCYRTPAEILVGFDIQCCKALLTWDAKMHKVVCYVAPTFMAAIKCSCNWTDPERQSLSYTARLLKYWARGMRVVVPGLDRDCVHSSVYLDAPTEARGLAQLLVAELLIKLFLRKCGWCKMGTVYRALAYLKVPTCDYDDIYNDIKSSWGWAVLAKFKKSVHLFCKKFGRINVNSKVDISQCEWLTIEPGRQATGSFQPTDFPWYASAYGRGKTITYL